MAARLLLRGRRLVPRLTQLIASVEEPASCAATRDAAAAWSPMCRGFSATAAPCQREPTAHAEEEPAGEPSTGRQKKLELVAAFTCGQCGARSVRAFSRVAYERGVVIARCGGCERQHLLADRLGWFGEAGDIEDFLREKGESIRKRVDGTLEVSEEDLLGWSKPA